MAGGFVAGSAMLVPAFDPATTRVLRHFQHRLEHMTPAELDHEERQVEALPGRVADELRRLVGAEREVRRAAARLAGGAS